MTSTAIIYYLVGIAVGTGVLLLDRPRYLRSPLVLITLIPLSIFVVSSTGNTIGQGLVMALLMGILIEMLWVFRDTAYFNQQFAAGAKQPLTQREIKWCVAVWAGVTALVMAITIL